MHNQFKEILQRLLPLLNKPRPDDVSANDIDQLMICLGVYLSGEYRGLPSEMLDADMHQRYRQEWHPGLQTLLPGVDVADAKPWLSFFGLVVYQELAAGIELERIMARLRKHEPQDRIDHTRLLTAVYLLRFLPAAVLVTVPDQSIDEVVATLRIRARNAASAARLRMGNSNAD